MNPWSKMSVTEQQDLAKLRQQVNALTDFVRAMAPDSKGNRHLEKCAHELDVIEASDPRNFGTWCEKCEQISFEELEGNFHAYFRFDLFLAKKRDYTIQRYNPHQIVTFWPIEDIRRAAEGCGANCLIYNVKPLKP